jgi:2-keto-4-pentenoate hydratase
VTSDLGRSTARAATISAVADRLRTAAAEQRPCLPVRDVLGETDIELAYAVQRLLNDERSAGGARPIGRKIGLTALSVQKQFGVDQPDFGVLFDDMLVPAGVQADTARLLQPRVEAEIAFVLSDDIVDGHATADSVRPAIAECVAAIEIVDSRVVGWDIAITDTVADNASAGLFVLGPARFPLAAFVPALARMSLTIDGVLVATGRGTDCLGDPLNAVAWLARKSVQVRSPLRAGDIVLSGSLGPVVPVHAGAAVAAEIFGLGSVSVTFAGEVAK